MNRLHASTRRKTRSTHARTHARTHAPAHPRDVDRAEGVRRKDRARVPVVGQHAPERGRGLRGGGDELADLEGGVGQLDEEDVAAVPREEV